MLKLQKHHQRKSLVGAPSRFLFEEIRFSTVVEEFSLKEVQIYDCLSKNQLLGIETSTIEKHQLQKLMVDSLQLTFLYIPLKQCLNRQTFSYINHYSIKAIIRILHRGQFYRFIHNQQHKLTVLVNNRTTQANVKIIIASLLIYAARKLTIDEIVTSILFFNLEAALNNDPLTIAADSQKIIKVLKKIERIIKPGQFKMWFESVKSSADYGGNIQIHQFLFLSSLTEKKMNHGIQHIMIQPKMSSLFKNLNINVKSSQFEAHKVEEVQTKKTHVRGLSFVEPRQRCTVSLSKQILKQFRLRDPSKNKRPNTDYLRNRIQSVCQFIVPKYNHEQCQNKYSQHRPSIGPIGSKSKLRRSTASKKSYLFLKVRA